MCCHLPCFDHTEGVQCCGDTREQSHTNHKELLLVQPSQQQQWHITYKEVSTQGCGQSTRPVLIGPCIWKTPSFFYNSTWEQGPQPIGTVLKVHTPADSPNTTATGWLTRVSCYHSDLSLPLQSTLRQARTCPSQSLEVLQTLCLWIFSVGGLLYLKSRHGWINRLTTCILKVGTYV